MRRCSKWWRTRGRRAAQPGRHFAGDPDLSVVHEPNVTGGSDMARAPRRGDESFDPNRVTVVTPAPRGRPLSLAPALTPTKERRAMTKHLTGTRKDWLAARLELLEAEKDLTRRSDELARRRQELPWVRIDKEYRFETDGGSESLADLFRGRSQL